MWVRSFASQLHLFSHAVFKALLFLAAGAVIHGVGTRDMGQMGGLGKKMPFNRAVFIIGALALAGVPILNGFWSKEIILEHGLDEGPLWGYIGMLAGAGLTALYTSRMVWRVFFGKARSKQHAHDAGPAMRIATGLLAFGTLTTWLLMGGFGELLESSLPYHHLHVESLATLVEEVVTAPATLVALGLVLAGFLAWFFHSTFLPVGEMLRTLNRAAASDFGFEAVNRTVVDIFRSAGDTLRRTQTGYLNWNVFGIVAGLVVTLVILALGA